MLPSFILLFSRCRNNTLEKSNDSLKGLIATELLHYIANFVGLAPSAVLPSTTSEISNYLPQMHTSCHLLTVLKVPSEPMTSRMKLISQPPCNQLWPMQWGWQGWGVGALPVGDPFPDAFSPFQDMWMVHSEQLWNTSIVIRLGPRIPALDYYMRKQNEQTDKQTKTCYLNH